MKRSEIKIVLKIVPIALLLVCCTPNKYSEKDELSLTEGAYYLNYSSSNDTLKFQSEKYDKGGWNNTVWEITSDSIFQGDSHGLAYYLGKDKCSYALKNDTLYVSYRSRSRIIRNVKSRRMKTDRYVVVKTNKECLEIIAVDEAGNVSHDLRSDIQLR